MNTFTKEILLQSIETALIDRTVESYEDLSPKLISNDYKKGERVLHEINKELDLCTSFIFSVAFVSESGLTVLLSTLKKLQEKGIKGKILTSDYLNFTSPTAIKRLMQFTNIELKVCNQENFHAKGYIFFKSDGTTIIIGSANITSEALTKNKEWNLRVTSLNNGKLVQDTLNEFNSIWNDSQSITDEWLEYYTEIYNSQKRVELPKDWNNNFSKYKELKPNSMQVEALESLNRLRQDGESKAILISATGTGKTYLAAFDVKQFNAKRVLFVVHRESIARKAMQSFRNLLGKVNAGVLSGNSKAIDADFIFSTVQTISKPEVMEQFKSDHFDYIIIDEAHRSGAPSYQRVINYFNPQFMLAMTATPERSDGFNIYKLYDNNIAYEIRLQRALEENLLSSFHYFGVRDLEINGALIDDQASFNQLTSEERINHIQETIEFYGYSGNKVKGLIFVSRLDEAFELSNSLNLRQKPDGSYYKTIALTGTNSEEERQNAFNMLESDDNELYLDYIFSVDILNEGVDIPAINQVVMLRPTQSAIIFVQQMGRGLRKHNDKDYVVIIDFIGNYQKNFLIPIALSGDKTYNKDNLRKTVSRATIPGCSTINFDEVVKEQIYKSIDTTNFRNIEFIKESYNNLKIMLDKIPTLIDFHTYGSIEPTNIFENINLGSYYMFLSKYEKEYTVKLNKFEENYLEFVSKKLASGKRIHELLLIEMLINKQTNISIIDYSNELNNRYGILLKDLELKSVINVLSQEFNTGTGKETYSDCKIVEQKDISTSKDIIISSNFKKVLVNNDFKLLLEDTIAYGTVKYNEEYSNKYSDTNLCLYKKYTYEDVCRILNWEKQEVALNIGGYKYDSFSNTYPVFINYHKGDEISHTINYEDRFISQSELVAISKSGRKIESEDVQKFVNSEKLNISVHLFVRKNKDDVGSKEFYYLGKISPIGKYKEFTMGSTDKNAVEIHYKLDVPVKRDLYDYIIK